MSKSRSSAFSASQPAQKLDHAACLLIGRHGILLRGESGSGKSQLRRYLANQCRHNGLFSALISDDYVRLVAPETSDALIAVAPETTFGKQEIRGVGICPLEGVEKIEKVVRLHLVVNLVAPEQIVRMPEPENTHTSLLNRTIHKLEVPRQDCITASDLIFAQLSTFHP
jgi:serine kinase of HPr protein (carbohydrate metabolism regulator)